MPNDEIFLYTLRTTRLSMLTDGPSPAEQQVLAEHSQYLSALAEQGQALMFGRTANKDERTFGIVVFRAATPQAAEEVMAADPAVRSGIMKAELFPFRLAYPPASSISD
jgi:uncharacterized protein YciI